MAKVALITPVQLEGTAPLMGFNAFPSATNEFQNILLLACRRYILYEDKEAAKGSGELWVSDELDIVMRDIGGSNRWEAISLTRGDPKERSFIIPPDYSKVKTPEIRSPKRLLK